MKDLESHHISEIRPGNLRMINKTGNYSQFWKIGSTLENIKAKVAKVEAPNFLPPISRAEFNEIWFSRSLKESYLVAVSLFVIFPSIAVQKDMLIFICN